MSEITPEQLDELEKVAQRTEWDDLRRAHEALPALIARVRKLEFLDDPSDPEHGSTCACRWVEHQQTAECSHHKKLVTEAVAAERERCARVAQNFAEELKIGRNGETVALVVEETAHRIREGDAMSENTSG